MKLTNAQIIEAVFAATVANLPGRALLRTAAGVTLSTDEWRTMKKAISHASTDRVHMLTAISAQQSLNRIHCLERKQLLVVSRAGNAFSFWLPEEHLGQCWFRARALLKLSGIPDYGERPRSINTEEIESAVTQLLLNEFRIELMQEDDNEQLHIVPRDASSPPRSIGQQCSASSLT